MLPITVVVPYFKGSKFLTGLTASVRDQGAAEVVVVVDGGAGLAEVRAAFSDVSHVEVLATPAALGTAGARNFGAARSTQDWITFLDQDDSWPNNFLRELFARANDGPLAYDNQLFTEQADGSAIDEHESIFERAGWTETSISANTAYHLIAGFPMIKLLLPRRDFLAIDGFREDIRAIEDFDLTWRLLASGRRISFVDSPRGSYLVRSGSITNAVSQRGSYDALHAQRTWTRIWLALARTNSFTLKTRALAIRNATRHAFRALKITIRRSFVRGRI